MISVTCHIPHPPTAQSTSPLTAWEMYELHLQLCIHRCVGIISWRSSFFREAFISKKLVSAVLVLFSSGRMKFLHEKLIVFYFCPIIGSLRQMYRVTETTKQKQGIQMQSPSSAHLRNQGCQRGQIRKKESILFCTYLHFPAYVKAALSNFSDSVFKCTDPIIKEITEDEVSIK